MKTFVSFLFVLLALCGDGLLVQAQTVRARVISNRSGKGLRNIPVSNGDTVVLSGRKGYVELPVGVEKVLFAIPPSDLQPASIQSAMLPQQGFIQTSNDAQDFILPLEKTKVESDFRFAAIGDVQVDDAQQLQYAAQTLFSEIQDRPLIDFALFMGDLVNDDPLLLDDFSQLMQQLPYPAWAVFGNHDRTIAENQSRTSDYKQHFLTPTYAFNRSKAHFIVINNVYPKGKFGYEGLYDAQQLRFVEQSLRFVDADRLIVLAQHIPLLHTRNKEAMIELLEGRNVLVLSGHTHTLLRHLHPVKKGRIQELVVGAVSGSWWTGEKDVFGIPAALMSCGSPRNYMEISVQDTAYTITYKGVGLDPGRQMDLWIAGADSTDRHVPDLDSIAPGTVLANVYAGFSKTVVWMQVDQQEPIRMQHVPRVAPLVARIAAFNKDDVYPTKHSRRLPLRSRPSPHIWQAKLPQDLSSGWHLIRIKAKDAYGFSADQTTRVFVP